MRILPLFLVLSLSSTALQAAPSSSQTPQSAVVLRATLPKIQFRVGEAVEVTVVLTNVGSKSIFWNSADENSLFSFSVADGIGRGVPRTLYGDEVLRHWGVFRNVRREFAPGATRKFVFPIGRMFDLSAGGTFSLVVAKDQTKAAPLRFSLEKTPAAQIIEHPAPFPMRGKWLFALNPYGGPNEKSGQIARFEVAPNGALWPTRRAAIGVAARSVDMVSAGENRLYVVSDNTIGRTSWGGYAGQNDGVIAGFEVLPNGFLRSLDFPTPLPNDFFTLIYDPARRRLISFTSYQHGQGYHDGGRAFEVQNDGKLKPITDFQLDGTSTLAFSPDGTMAFEANFPISAFRVTPGGTFSRVTPMGWRLEEGGANDLWVSPDSRFLMVSVEAATQKKDGKAVAWADGVALFRIVPDAPDAQILQRVPGLFRQNAAQNRPAATKPLGFDPSGRFVLTHSKNGQIASFSRGEDGVLTQISQIEAEQGFDYSSERGAARTGLVFDADGHTFWTLGSGKLRAFALNEKGEIRAVGAPRPCGGTAVQLVEAPLSAPRDATLKNQPIAARLEHEIYPAGARIFLDIDLKNASLRAVPAPIWKDFVGEIVRLQPDYSTRKGTIIPQPVPMLQAGRDELKQTLAPLDGQNLRLRLEISRLFDLSRAGNYRVKVPCDGGAIELEFSVED